MGYWLWAIGYWLLAIGKARSYWEEMVLHGEKWFTGS
jgi:hypothetical protein